MPEAVSVANCREKTARSRVLTPRKRSNRLSSANACFFSATSRTIRPRSRSCSETCAFDSASTSPRDGTPATSTARNAYVLISRPVAHRRHGRLPVGLRRGPQQAVELFGHGGPLLGELARHPAHADKLGQVGVHRLHPDRGGGLDRRVDLVRLALPDQVA